MSNGQSKSEYIFLGHTAYIYIYIYIYIQLYAKVWAPFPKKGFFLKF